MNQAGFPLLKISVEKKTDNKIVLAFDQTRMLLQGPKREIPQKMLDQVWQIPIEMEVADGRILELGLMSTKYMAIEIDRVIDEKSFVLPLFL